MFARQSAHVKCFRLRGGQETGRSTIVEVYHLVCLAGGVLINKIIAQSYTTVCLAEWSRPTRVRRSTSCGQLNTQLCLAEWSKALALGANLFGGVGSNPTADILPRSAVTICLVSSVALFLSCQEVFWCSSQCLFRPESRLLSRLRSALLSFFSGLVMVNSVETASHGSKRGGERDRDGVHPAAYRLPICREEAFGR